MSFLKKMVNAETFDRGEYLKPGRGTVIVKDVKKIKTRTDPETVKFEFYVKESHPTKPGVEPNAVGTTFALLNFINTYDAAPGSAKKYALAILGPSAKQASPEQLEGILADLFRIDEKTGYTDESKPCEAKGFELNYETYEQDTKDKKTTLVLPNFFKVDLTEEQVAANAKLVG